MRRCKNMIKSLTRSDGEVIEDVDELKSMTAEFYETLYTSEGVHDMDRVLDKVPRKVTHEINTIYPNGG
jgi:hypothetical protein